MSSDLSALSPIRNGRVYLLDASIYVYQGFRVLPSSLVDCHGVQSNAVHGFIEFLLQILESERPHFLGCVFDPVDNAAARQAIDPAYKSHRKARPDELTEQFGRCRQWCDLVGVAQFERAGQEADDIIAALANLARSERLPVTVVSADKDLAQVIRPGDELWEPVRGRRLQYGRLKKQLGINPEQVADLLALCGDKADNIQGVPGLGVRMAARLLAKWGNLQQLGEHLGDVAFMKFRGAKAIAPVLAQHWPVVLASRRLTGSLAVTDLPLSIDALAVKAGGDWQAMAASLALPESSIARWQAAIK